MGMRLLKKYDYKTLSLINYKVGFLGQSDNNDELDKIFTEIKNSKVLIIGTPVYWYYMSGALKTFIDRSSESSKVQLRLNFQRN
jgi:multimeric flavodoxin WrbA